MNWNGLNSTSSENRVLRTNNGLEMLSAALENMRSSSLTGSSALSGQTVPSTEQHSSRSTSHPGGIAMPESFSNSINGFPLAMYTQSPLLFPFFPPQLRTQNVPSFSSSQANSAMPPLAQPGVPESYELRCLACGLKYGSVPELHDHIMKEHFSVGSEGKKQESSSNFENQAAKDFLESAHKEHSSNVNNSSRNQSTIAAAAAQRHIKEVEKSFTDFPIPTPNFTLLGSYGNFLNAAPPIATHASRGNNNSPKLFPEGSLPSTFKFNSNLESVPIPVLPGAYGMMNPFLAYQNMIAANGLARSGTLPSGLNPGACLDTFPFLRYPNSPSAGLLPVPGRFPYFPGLPMMLPTSNAPVDTVSPAAEGSASKNEVDTTHAGNLMSTPDAVKTADDISSAVNFHSYTDTIHRRLSVPLLGMNKEFRVPHSYTRSGKPVNNNLPQHSPIMELSESILDSHKDTVTGTQKHHLSNTHHTSSAEKSASTRLNAKSIEQHISKLISNNEKVLLNPTLERVKPRRVFRRSSLDPASLSSYAAAISGGQLHVESDFNDVTHLRKSNTLNDSISSSVSNESAMRFRHGLSSEYEKMIQLTRAPQMARPFQRSVSVSGESSDPSNRTSKLQETDGWENRESLLGKRNSTHSDRLSHLAHYKKPRRSSFFECNDCGVRYRKEENFKIHKRMYCKYRDSAPDAGSRTFKPSLHQFGFEEAKYRRHSDIPISAPDFSHTSLKAFAKDDSSTNLKSLNVTVTSTSSNMAESDLPTCKMKPIPGFLQPDIASNPMKLLHNELCRTRSAEPALQTESSVQVMKKKRQELMFGSGAPHIVQSDVDSHTSSSNTSYSSISQSHGHTSHSTLLSSIPASMLPPNKRHLKRHLVQESMGSSEGELADSSEGSNILSFQASSVNPCNQVSGSCVSRAHHETGMVKVTTAHINNLHSSLTSTDNNADLDEVLVPRSNYKLLLQQLSLRNMQDIGQMESLQSSYGKSVWSWQQIQKCFQGQNHSEPNPCRSATNETSQAASHQQRKFAVPSRLSQAADFSNGSVLANVIEEKHANVINVLPENDQLTNDQSMKISAPKHLQLNGQVSRSGTVNSDTYKAIDINVSEESGTVDTVSASPGKTERQPTDLLPVESASTKVTSSSFSKSVVERDVGASAIMFSHLWPILSAQCHVSYCCMLNPQPACMETKVASDEEAKQLSMYSDWAISDPILIPEDLSVSDILTGWSKSKAGYNKDIVTMVKKVCELIVTDHIAYEESQKEVNARNAEHSLATNSGNHVTSLAKREKNFKPNEELNFKDVSIPVLMPSPLVSPLTKPVYVSCHQPRSTKKLQGEFHVPASSSVAITALLKPTCTENTADVQLSTDQSYKSTLKSRGPCSRMNEVFSATEAMTCVRSDSSTESRSKTVMKPEVPLKERRATIIEGSSGERPTESDSEPVDEKIQLSGKVKRRRTRRERSATSPREKRRALQCKSPPSPTTDVPVHQNKSCTNATEEKLRGCALCSMKAGRTDLITDASAACQPCRDAAKKKQLLIAGQKSTSLSNSSRFAPSPLYLSPPASASAFLDKTRASSGSTQHWVSNTTPDVIEHHASNPGVFQYPSPRSSKSSSSDGAMDTTAFPTAFMHSSHSAANRTDKVVDVDFSKNSGSLTPEHSPVVVSPSLAEVVSEVMRSAAIQSKQQNNSAKRHHLLSNSRALLPGNHPSSMVDRKEKTPIKSTTCSIKQTAFPSDAVSSASRLTTSETLHNKSLPNPVRFGRHINKHNNGDSLAINFANAAIRNADKYEITVTPATPPALPTKEDEYHNPREKSITNAIPDINTRSPVVPIEEAPNLNRRAISGQGEDLYNENQRLKLSPRSRSPAPEAGESQHHDDGSCGSEEDGIKDDLEGSHHSDGAARPFKCSECKIAFRIGGHLAKHLRSKGHMVAMQKKTLNRLKLRQMQLCIGGVVQSSSDNDPPDDNDCKEATPPVNSTSIQPFINQNRTQPSTLLDGTEGLAQSQVRALLEGSGEYACVPNSLPDDVIGGSELADDLSGSLDPRPFKCIACKVAFRFQGHLDRHFRSNIHLIAVGHYEQDAVMLMSRASQANGYSDDQATVKETKVAETLILREETIPCSSGDSNKADSPIRTSSPYSDLCASGTKDDVYSPTVVELIRSEDGRVLTSSQLSIATHENVFVASRRPRSRSPSDTEDENKPVAPHDTGTLGINPNSDQHIDQGAQLSNDCFRGEYELGHLTNSQAVTQLRTLSSDQSADSVSPLSSDCLARNVVMACQVSCT